MKVILQDPNACEPVIHDGRIYTPEQQFIDSFNENPNMVYEAVEAGYMLGGYKLFKVGGITEFEPENWLIIADPDSPPPDEDDILF